MDNEETKIEGRRKAKKKIQQNKTNAKENVERSAAFSCLISCLFIYFLIMSNGHYLKFNNDEDIFQ